MTQPSVPQNLYPPLNNSVVFPVPQRERGMEKAPPPVGAAHLMTQEWTEFFLSALGFDGFTAQPYAAANFTPAGVWTVVPANVIANNYFLRGRLATVQIALQNTTVTAPSATLSQTIPGGAVAARNSRVTFTALDNGAVVQAYATVTTGSNQIVYTRVDGVAWSASVGLTDITVEMSFEVQG